MPFRLTISRAVIVFGAAALLGLGAIIGTGIGALQHLKVGGPLYDKIKLGNDLVADILPPPEYVIEAYLEALNGLLAEEHWAGAADQAGNRRRAKAAAAAKDQHRAEFDADVANHDTTAWFER